MNCCLTHHSIQSVPKAATEDQGRPEVTIAVACNLADGVVMGVDSAITIHGIVKLPDGGQQSGIMKVYNDAEKLFPLFDLPVGIASFGLAQLELRTIQSYVREFEHNQSQEEVDDRINQ